MLKPKIIYQDDQLLVIDKPAGMVVNRAESVKETTVQDWADNKLKINPPSASGGGGEKFKIDDFYGRAGIVHRLDKETSGLLIIAKTPAAFTDLQGQFKKRTIEKKYLALVHGKVVPKSGTIKLPVKRSSRNRQKFAVEPEGRPSQTDYLVTAYFDDYSLVGIKPKTGRTHQIRVHFQFIGHPVVGDKKYLGKRQCQRTASWCPRLFLHAFSLKFKQPKTGKLLEIEIPLAADLKQALDSLENKK